MKSHKQECQALAAALGVQIVTSGDYGFTVTVEAPAGKRWRHSGVHELVSCKNDDRSCLGVWQDICERMRDGLEDCDSFECDWCMSKAVLAAILLAVFMIFTASPAFAQCAKLSPGTQPGTGYKATFSNGLVVMMFKAKQDCSWEGTTKVSGAVFSADFHHQGLFAGFPEGGAFVKPGVLFRLHNGLFPPHTGYLAVAEIRDGSGPWTVALKDERDRPTGVTVTIVGVP